MSNKHNRVLVIDDEAPIRRLLRVMLTAHDFDFVEAAGGREGINLAARYKPDVVLVDLGLPDLDGKKVIGELRAWTQVPLLVLTVRGQEEEKIAAFDAGADDYITKPFSAGELLARIRGSLRRSLTAANEPLLTCGDLALDLNLRRATIRGGEIKLTPHEYDILKLLLVHAGRVLTHRQILQAVWGTEHGEATQYVRVYMNQLRHKIESDPARPGYITTVPGVGYRLRHP
jgi:Response regulators consisting of a CheY-like receiver domain and a winged-helix DNA-binding domain